MAEWMTYARSLIGVREIVGPQHNPSIMGWIKALGSKVLGIDVKDDETAWCGTYVAHVMQTHGLDLPKIAVRASSWGSYGRQLNGPRYGCILVFTRSGGGHVGFYVGEDRTHYHVLGGNQSNSVNIMRLDKSRLTSMRWPHGPALPPQKTIHLAPSGAPVSGNEA